MLPSEFQSSDLASFKDIPHYSFSGSTVISEFFSEMNELRFVVDFYHIAGFVTTPPSLREGTPPLQEGILKKLPSSRAEREKGGVPERSSGGVVIKSPLIRQIGKK